MMRSVAAGIADTQLAASSNRLLALTALLYLLVLPALASGNPTFEATGLIRTGGQVTHQTQLPAAGQYLIWAFDAEVDLSLTISVKGADPITFNSPLLRDEIEMGLITVSLPQLVQITVMAPEYADVESPYRLSVQPLLVESPPDQLRAEGYRALAAASQVSKPQQTAEQQLALFARASSIFRQLGEHRLVARSLFSAAMTHYWRNLDFESAAENAAQAAVVYRQLKMDKLYANCLQLQAASLIETANAIPKAQTRIGIARDAATYFNKALVLFTQAQAIQKAHGREYDVAQIKNNIGLTYFYMDDWDNARKYYHEAAEAFRSIGEWAGELNPRANLSVIDYELGRLRDARMELTRLLEILPPGKERAFRADQLDNLAAVNLELANYDDALRGFSQALGHHQELDDAKGAGRSLSGIGTLYSALGRADLASKYLNEALQARRLAKDGRGQLATLRQIARLHRTAGRWHDAATMDLQALTIATAPSDRATVLIALTRDHLGSGDLPQAKRVLDDALVNAAQAGSPLLLASTALVAGDLNLSEKRYVQAVKHYHDAQSVFESLHVDHLNADALHGLAQSALAQAKYEQAIEYVDRALTIVERVRATVGNPQLRAHYLAQRQRYYETAIDTLMTASMHAQSAEATKLVHRALRISERSKSRVMHDALSVSGSSQLTQSERALYLALAEARFRHDQLLQAKQAGELINPAEVSMAARKLDTVETQLALASMETSRGNEPTRQSPVLDVLDVTELMARLRPNEILLHYAIGTENSYRWVISRDAIRSDKLPPRRTIETQVVAAYRSFLRPNVDRASLIRAASVRRSLAQLLFGNLLDLSSTQALTIVVDESMQLVPFSALEWPSSTGTSLLETASVKTTLSSSISAQVQRNSGARQTPRKTIAVFADPVYSRGDERLPQLLSGQPSQSISSPRRRLPYSGEEAHAIRQLVESDNAIFMLGTRASTQAFDQLNVSDFRIIHLAAHASIDAIYPALSAVYLSEFDASGNSVDGALRLFDFEHRAFDAELVVLSACSTGLGKGVRGEGYIGPAYAFLGAGAQGVISSLWAVPDRATATLMSLFYERLLVQGDSPPEALQAAQHAMRETLRWRDPFYWAAFVYVGV